MASSVAAISSCVAPTRRVIMNEREARTRKRGGGVANLTLPVV